MGRWLPGVDLARWHTFRLPARAAEGGEIVQPHDWLAWQERRAHYPCPEVVVGVGSNTLFVADFPGRVVRIATRGWQVVGEDSAFRWIDVAAGEPWAPLVADWVARGWGGVENLAAIPGTAGAAVVQNIGAYGVEVGQWVDSVTLWHLDSGVRQRRHKAELAFGYRTSWFKTPEAAQWIIETVRLRLPKVPTLHLDYPDLTRWFAARAIDPRRLPPEEQVRALFQAVTAIRAAKLPDPNERGNAGSFFLNPIVAAEEAEALTRRFPELPHHRLADGRVKLAAAWLIDRAGLKGVRQGGVAVSARHALVLENLGSATGADLLALMRRIQERVWHTFGLWLQPEPILVGETGPLTFPPPEEKSRCRFS